MSEEFEELVCACVFVCVLQLSAHRGHSAKPEHQLKKSLDSYRPLSTEYQHSTDSLWLIPPLFLFSLLLSLSLYRVSDTR